MPLKNYANTLQNTAQSGLYNMGMGNQLAQQQFAGQRLSLEQNFQDQMAQANRAAAMSGRSGNDPILRARLAQEQTRQQAQLQANQSSAAVDLGRQYTVDSLGLQGQAVNALGGLASQAYSNQQSLFGMSQQANAQEFSQGLQAAQYEMSRGGGAKGALTGALSGLGAGAQAAQGFGAMFGGGAGAASGLASAGQFAGLANNAFFSQPSYEMGSAGAPAQTSYSLSGPASYSGGGWGLGQLGQTATPQARSSGSGQVFSSSPAPSGLSGYNASNVYNGYPSATLQQRIPTLYPAGSPTMRQGF